MREPAGLRESLMAGVLVKHGGVLCSQDSLIRLHSGTFLLTEAEALVPSTAGRLPGDRGSANGHLKRGKSTHRSRGAIYLFFPFLSYSSLDLSLSLSRSFSLSLYLSLFLSLFFLLEVCEVCWWSCWRPAKTWERGLSLSLFLSLVPFSCFWKVPISRSSVPINHALKTHSVSSSSRGLASWIVVYVTWANEYFN